jgi:hypothetical protein
MKIGDQAEVLYNGEWVEGKITAQQNVESDPKTPPVRTFSVDTGKALVMGVAPEYGTMRAKGAQNAGS